jgi:hypothetical protein
LEAGDGTEGLGVALDPTSGRLLLNHTALPDQLSQAFVPRRSHTQRNHLLADGRFVFDSINLDEAILVPGPEDQAAALGQRRAEIEALGMRMEGQAAAQRARYAAACQEAGGVAIDPY